MDESMHIYFHIYVNKEIKKKLNMRFYTVSETEKNSPLPNMSTQRIHEIGNFTTNCVNILQHTHTRDREDYVDITEYVYLL